ncbi:hypothetical protein B0T14DRAFT_585285, partial [Immersiella caudata]
VPGQAWTLQSASRTPRQHLPPSARRRTLALPVQGAGSDEVELFAPGKRAQWLALLSTNRTLWAEASATLYGQHKFVLVETIKSQAGMHLLQTFFDNIGLVNAGYLTHVCIKFPVVPDLRELKLLKDKCRSLRPLEAFMYSHTSKGLASGSYDLESTSTPEALLEVDAQFKAIPSLRTVLINLHNGPLVPRDQGVNAGTRLGRICGKIMGICAAITVDSHYCLRFKAHPSPRTVLVN